MKISLIHPSRGRPQQAQQTKKLWETLSSSKFEIEYILILDNDDSEINLYKAVFNEDCIITGNHCCIVEATNAGAVKSTGDILVYMSDDFLCPINWDESIVSIF